MTHVPSWYALALLVLAAYRCWRLIGLDTITQPLRMRITRLPDSWQHGDDPPDGYREWLAVWLQCPWCCGFYCSVAWWAAWLAFPHAVLIVAVPWAISGLVGMLGHFTTE